MLSTPSMIDILDIFEQLKTSLTQLCNAVQNEPQLMAWVQGSLPARQQACQALSQLHYSDDQAPRDILICAGFIGATAPTLKLAMDVNDCKEAFKKSVLTLKSGHPNIKVNIPRIHLKQCYRKIPILEHAPSKISWTWAHTRAINKISINEALSLLRKKGDDIGIQIQIQKLNQLSEHDSLAVIQELAPHLRANLVFKTQHNVTRKMIKGPIPIFFPCDELTALPDFKPPKEKKYKNEERVIRSDLKIEAQAYLPAIRAHRYRPTT